jgi:hypothetical protein
VTAAATTLINTALQRGASTDCPMETASAVLLVLCKLLKQFYA